MGDFYGSTDHSRVAVRLGWWIAWQDADRNVSSVGYALYARRTNTGYTTSGTFHGGITVNGSNHPYSGQLSIGPDDGWKLFFTFMEEVAHNADGWKPMNISAYGGIPGTGWNTTTVGGSFDLGRLLGYPPEVKTITAARQSDTQILVAQTYFPGDARSPIEANEIERAIVSGDGVWRSIINPQGTLPSYADTSVSANTAYRYRAHTWNGRGGTAWKTSEIVYTTPAAPAGVTASKAADLSVTVTWQNAAAYTPASFEIYDNGTRIATVAGTTTSYRHANPSSSQTHTYKVKALAPGGLASGFSQPSNTIQLLAAPNAPTGLAPNGATVPAGNVKLSWHHNPIDSTPQTAYRLRYRAAMSSGWVSEDAASTVESLGVNLAAGPYTWQVQTKGAAEGFSPWSDVAIIFAADAPAVSISAPASTCAASVLTVAWSWSQPQGIGQAAWTATLKTASGDAIETLSGTGSTGEATFTTRLADKTSYQVLVTAASGLLTASASQAFSTSFPLPAKPALAAVWDETAGAATVTVAAGTGAATSTERVELERSIDDGKTWETVTGQGTNYTVADGECLSNGKTIYRATAWSVLPSANAELVELVTDSKAIWLSGGAGYAQRVPLAFNQKPCISAGRERASFAYEGRELPVAYAGEHRARTVEVSGILVEPGHVGLGTAPDIPATPLNVFTALAQTVEPLHLLRTPEGLRIYGKLSEIQADRTAPKVWGYSLKLVETDH